MRLSRLATLGAVVALSLAATACGAGPDESPSASATPTAQAAPSATLQHGDKFACRDKIPDSDDPGCWYFEVATVDFEAGEYDDECIKRGGNFGQSGTLSSYFPENGVARLTCWSGYDGVDAYRVLIHDAPGGTEGDGNDVLTPWTEW